MATRYIHVPNKSVIDNRLDEWLAAAEYVIHLDQLSATLSTGEQTSLAFIPEDVLITGIGWQVKSPWVNDSAELSGAMIRIGSSSDVGDTDDSREWLILTAWMLCSSDNHGFVPLNHHDSAGYNVIADIGFGTDEGTEGTAAGTLDLWIKYRPMATVDGPLAGVRAR